MQRPTVLLLVSSFPPKTVVFAVVRCGDDDERRLHDGDRHFFDALLLCFGLRGGAVASLNGI